MQTDRLPGYADIASAIRRALARHANRSLNDHLIDALILDEDGSRDHGWVVSFVIMPEDLAASFEHARAEVESEFPRAALGLRENEPARFRRFN